VETIPHDNDAEDFETVASAISSILASPIESHEHPAVAEIIRFRSAARRLCEAAGGRLPPHQQDMLWRGIGRHASHTQWPWAVLRAIEEELADPELPDVPRMTTVSALRTLIRYGYAECPGCLRPIPGEPILRHWSSLWRCADEDAKVRAGAAPLAGVA
jgi:hypothetical protein